MQILSVGSSHSDDQVGWLVADLLRERGFEQIHIVHNVDELLWYLTPDSPSIIVDACQSGSPVGTQFRFEWPDPAIDLQIGRTSHGINIPYALRLAEVLGKLPREVIVFAIEIRSSYSTEPMAVEVITAAHGLADRIELEIAAQGGSNRCMNDL
ncbi:hydrogenase maturation protease [Bremerella sp. P1]|uniref:hydrogenase maturation protease n=1 Tax=Bremerella sp. P1 TaxID=3026424 RepID=UPI002367D6F5|nr:hydrogenase maturation protease [Bremerella sp. P1]WDI41715.1 hydrogenase maturation protease [Bremerella sp. P1]